MLVKKARFVGCRADLSLEIVFQRKKNLYRAAVSVVHALHEVGRTEEHATKALLNLLIGDIHSLIQNQNPEILFDLPLIPVQSQNQMIIHENHIDFPAKSIELE